MKQKGLPAELGEVHQRLQKITRDETGYPGVDEYLQAALQNIRQALSNLGDYTNDD